MAAKKNVHAGHRSRMREEFKERGFKDWHEHKVLEYLLFNIIRVADTNELAHSIINSCENSFADVFRASREKLTDVIGVGPETAEYIYTLGEFVRYYNGVRFEANRTVLDSKSCEDYLLNLFDGSQRENFYMICLNSKYEVIHKKLIYEGNIDSLDVDVTQIVRIAVKCDATYVVLSHNHPSGIAAASNADIVSTQAIERALNIAGIRLMDHIIVAGGKCVSMRNEYPELSGRRTRANKKK